MDLQVYAPDALDEMVAPKSRLPGTPLSVSLIRTNDPDPLLVPKTVAWDLNGISLNKCIFTLFTEGFSTLIFNQSNSGPVKKLANKISSCNSHPMIIRCRVF